MFTKKILSTAVAMVATFGVVQVYAADVAKEDGVEEIVVSGIRESLAKALDVKKEKIQIVDSIVAEDIGKFPDNNLVESLQRVTGVQVTNRGSGEVSGISIRGLPDVTTTINGRNIFTASGTAVAIQDIPTSLIKQVDVYKTRSADQIESGIAGVVDVKTQRPFDFTGSKFVIAARDVYQEQAGKTEPVVSALASDRWDTGAGDFGALVNVSYAKTSYRDQSVTAGAMVPFATATPNAPFTSYERIFLNHGGVAENPIWTPGLLNGLSETAGATLPINGQPMQYILGRDAIFASDYTGTRKRTGANISLQFAPDDKSEYTFETFYNGYRNESYNSLLFSFVDWWGDYNGNPNAANVTLYPGTNVVKSRTTGHPYEFTSGDSTKGQTDSYVYSLGGKWDLTDNLKVKSEVVYQQSTFKSDFLAMRFDKVGYGVNVDFNSGGGLPAFGFIDNPATAGVDESNSADASQWHSAQLWNNQNKNNGSATTFTTDATYTTDFNFFKTVKFGVRYDDRKASEWSNKLKDPQGNDLDNGYNSTIDLSTPGLVSVNSGFFDGRSDVPTTWASASGSYLLSHADTVRGWYGVTAGALKENFNVDEKTTNLYAESDYEAELGGRTLDGQFGVRYTKVETDMAFGAASDSNSSSKLSPDLLVRYHWTDSLLTRLSYSETLRRPSFSALNPTIVYNPDVTNIGYGTAGGGNPDLKSTESKNYDMSLEWYFGKSSSLYGTLFKRDITGFVINFAHQVQHAKSSTDSTPYTYVLNQPYNASNGELHGAELGAVWFPENLPGLLDGFGVQASYTKLESSQTTPMTDSAGVITGTKKTSLFGVSDDSYSVVLAYDKDKLGARLSYSWRSAFLNNYEASLFANPLEVWRKPESSLDLQVSYKLLDNLELTMDGTNLTNEIYQSHYGKNGATVSNFGSSIYSRTFAVGARYSF